MLICIRNGPPFISKNFDRLQDHNFSWWLQYIMYCDILFNVSSPFQTVKHMWPFICQFIEKLFRETIEPAVRGAHTHLSTFNFSKVDMGQQVSLSWRALGHMVAVLWDLRVQALQIVFQWKLSPGRSDGCLCSRPRCCLPQAPLHVGSLPCSPLSPVV